MEKIKPSLPHVPGVYFMRGPAQEVLYVGKARDLAKRVAQYFKDDIADLKTRALVPLIRKVDYLPCQSEREALLLERKLIRAYQPFFNILWRDDKAYPYVRLSLQEDFPRLSWARRKAQDGALYFGPYPKVTLVKNLLRHLWKRRWFPLRPCRWDFSFKKPLDPKIIHSCIYYHTRQCPAPCAGRISPRDYRRIAEDASWFFEGRFDKLKTSFTKEMKEASKKLEFERAAELRNHLAALEHMGERVSLEQVDAFSLLQSERLTVSRAASALALALDLAGPPLHIEAVDISNLFGKQPVGSLVCLKNGEPFLDHYRRFKIKSVFQSDDYSMMKEVIRRHSKNILEGEHPAPDLLLVDGGKGQLSAALEALKEAGLSLPVAALAKREEEVFIPERKEAIALSPDSPALHLLQRVRDEAHRFAVTYHRLLRKKKLIPGEKI